MKFVPNHSLSSNISFLLLFLLPFLPQGNRLRLMVDERYTASVLLGMTQTIEDSAGERIPIKSSATICQNAYAVAMAENNLFGDHATATAAGSSPQEPKRVRRRGKYSPQERERLRRERNRMHAKRTRDRKKMLVEISEQMITKMENEARCLRDYLVSVKLMSVEESRASEERSVASQKELAQLKVRTYDGWTNAFVRILLLISLVLILTILPFLCSFVAGIPNRIRRGRRRRGRRRGTIV